LASPLTSSSAISETEQAAVNRSNFLLRVIRQAFLPPGKLSERHNLKVRAIPASTLRLVSRSKQFAKQSHNVWLLYHARPPTQTLAAERFGSLDWGYAAFLQSFLATEARRDSVVRKSEKDDEGSGRATGAS